jgi:hypothetical protein
MSEMMSHAVWRITSAGSRCRLQDISNAGSFLLGILDGLRKSTIAFARLPQVAYTNSCA